MKISGEAVEAAEQAMRGHDCHPVVNANIPHLARAALESAVPYLTPDREVLAKRIEQAIDASQLMGCGCCGGLYEYDKYGSASEALAAQLADALLNGSEVEERA